PVDHQHVSDVSTGAACITAGIFAKAYTILSAVPGYESYANDLLARAIMSWNWIVAHPTNYNPKSPGITPDGEWSYRINDDTSFRSFAAIELYIATGTSTYRTFFESAFNATGNPATAFPGIFDAGWGSSFGASGTSGHFEYVAPVNGINGITPGYFDYVNTTRPVTESIRTAIRNGFITSANQLVYRSQGPSGTYMLPMHMGNDLYWGSSGLFCANAYLLIQAHKWTGTESYREAAADALHWVCGRNTVNRNFITGNYGDYLHGTDHYSFYMFDHLNPVPGYLCGNVNMLSGYVLQYYIKYPWKYYLNIQTADFLEPCLPWQANLCYLLGYFANDLKLPQVIDTNYLREFSNAWLATPADENWNPNCNLVSSDEIINFLDFAELAKTWMEN
ncbi:MAG: glycoside hydrolase family 9 protein, partial [Phycisphaerales bacterium]